MDQNVYNLQFFISVLYAVRILRLFLIVAKIAVKFALYWAKKEFASVSYSSTSEKDLLP